SSSSTSTGGVSIGAATGFVVDDTLLTVRRRDRSGGRALPPEDATPFGVATSSGSARGVGGSGVAVIAVARSSQGVHPSRAADPTSVRAALAAVPAGAPVVGARCSALRCQWLEHRCDRHDRLAFTEARHPHAG